jgi:multicomponent Na+:H+ antiporter subunit C
MILALALAISILFGSGAFLLLKRDLIRVVGGVILLSNAANLFIVAAGLSRGREPIYPLPPGAPVSDPLVQALVLTAIVIGFGTVAVLLGLIYRAFTARRARVPVPTEPAVVAEPPVERGTG